jgi:signal transduction histidine kinase
MRAGRRRRVKRANMGKYNILMFLPKKNQLLPLVGLFVIYLGSALFGLKVSAVNEFAALVWPPSGIALAVLIIFGRRLWPAVFFAAFFANFYTGASFPVALGIAVGNTLEGLVAASICLSARGFSISLNRPIDVVKLVLTAMTCTVVSATIGVSSLMLGSQLSSVQVLNSWMQWWAGDTLAVISITPVFLTLYNRYVFQKSTRLPTPFIEKAIFTVALFFLSSAVLSSSPFLVVLIGFKGVYILVPLLLWGALRFGQVGATIFTFIISIMAIWNTSHGVGPFSEQAFIANLLHLFMFIVTMALTGMFVGSVVLQLNAAKRTAEFANSAKSSFLANMSHEIRSPLTAVIGFSELITDARLNEKEREKYQAAIRRNGELLTALIDDILDLSKIEAGKIEIRSSQVFLPELLSDIEVLLTKKVKEKNLQFKFSLDDSVPEMISTDGLRLRQILINLIGNAIKFTQRGSISVGVKRLASEDQLVTLAFHIQDTGLGISPEDVAKLFKPFSQIDPSTKRRFGGTGLGLMLAKRLAQLLGGDVVLKESKRNVGSHFELTIKAQVLTKEKTEQVKVATVGQQGGLSLHGLQVLLAEDLPDNQILVSHLLKLAGANVDVAADGKEAVQKANKTQYDVILMDLQMPVMDGYEAIAKLRGSGYHGTVIALTAHALESEKQHCLQAGFDDHIAKPINRDQLVENLSRFKRS